MTLKKKKNNRNKSRAPVSGAGSQDDRANGERTAVIVDLAAVRRKKTEVEDISPAAEGLRLVQAFLQIPDPVKRTELIRMVEDYVRRAR